MKSLFLAFVVLLCVAASFSFRGVEAKSPAVPSPADSTECTFCRFVVNFVEGYLAENATETEIVRYLDAVCALAPGGFKAQCQNFVQAEVPVIIAYIVKTESPETACTQLGFCSSKRFW